MAWNGFAGTGLWVDLSTGAIRKEPLDPELAERFLGGWGFTHKLAYDLIRPGVDALSPENVVVIGSGAISGTLAPGASKMMATTKLPASKTIGTPFAGGFSHQLKAAGYDYAVIAGRADRPVYLKILDDDVVLADAAELWGKDTFQTTDALRAKHGANASVIAIGQAGENLVRISLAMVDKFGTLGRGGLGAVFGSKNLKAVVANGTKGIRVADPSRFVELADSVLKAMLGYRFRREWIQIGPAIGLLVFGKVMGSYRNFSEDFEEWGAGAADSMKRMFKIVRSGHACPTCPLSCRAVLALAESEHAVAAGPTSTAIISTFFTGRYEGCDLSTSAKYADLCNRYGLDQHAVRGAMDYAVELYRSGILKREDTEGEELSWDVRTLGKLIEKMCRREGLGATLGDGPDAIAARFGKKAAARAVSIKGMIASLDPRKHSAGWELSECLNPRGSYVSPAITPAFAPGRTPVEIARFCRKLGVPEDAIERICYSDTEFSIPRLIKWSEDWYSVYSCLGVCVRQPVMLSYDPETAARLYTAATGLEMTPEALHQAGERAWNLLKAANVREGFSRKDDKFPERFFEPLKSGDKEIRLMNYNRTRELTREDVEKMFDDYYDERGWDIAKGIPTRQKLEGLGLSDVAEDLERGGFLQRGA